MRRVLSTRSLAMETSQQSSLPGTVGSIFLSKKKVDPVYKKIRQKNHKTFVHRPY
jgi:hypothetical protein